MAGRGSAVYGNPELFASDMAKIVDNEEFSDIAFVVGAEKKKIFAHKIILAARCEVFRAMFAEAKHQQKDKAKKDTLLMLQDVTPTVFRTVLDYIYTNTAVLSHATVVDVLASAVEYGLEGLIDCCVNFLSSHLKVDTACEAMQAASTYKQKGLQATCIAFIEQNTRKIFASPNWVEISEDTLCEILRSDNLQADEVEVLEAVKHWGNVNSVVSTQPLKDVLAKVICHVRFPLLPADMLTKLEQENEKQPVIPDKLISKAWKYQATKKADAKDAQFRPRAGTKTN